MSSELIGLPTSFSQRALWFLEQLNPGSPAYTSSTYYRLTGKLDVVTLGRAINAIVRRHEILRTTFVEMDGVPYQVIATELSLPVQKIDLSSLDHQERETEFRRLAGQQRVKGFDLADGPLLRIFLFRLGLHEHILYLPTHHMISDGWSCSLFFRELAELYSASVEARPPRLSEPPLQFADYAIWQNEWVISAPAMKQGEYWKQQFADAPSAPKIPGDVGRTPVGDRSSNEYSVELSSGVTASLGTLGQAQQVTQFMIVIAVLQVLLYRLSGQEHFVIGCAIAGRNRAELEHVIGPFVNAVPLLADLSGNPTFIELLGRVRSICLGAYENQDFPFEMIAHAIPRPHNSNANAWFDVFVDMVNVPDWPHSFGGVRSEREFFSKGDAKFDLTLYPRANSGKLTLDVVYNPSRFERSRIVEMLAQMQYLFSQAINDPTSQVRAYSLVTPQSRRCLPDPRAPLDDTWQGAIHELFSRQAERRPKTIAIKDRHAAWSYQNLEARSNQLAHYLISRGVQKGKVVAIDGERSANFVLALLGILKAGAAFLVLDPAHPAERSAHYYNAARAHCCILRDIDGSATLTLEFPSTAECFSLSDPSVLRLLQGLPTVAPHVVVGPDDLAYVAFTSGSTGEPKGVRCLHGSLSHFSPWLEREFLLSTDDRFSMSCGVGSNLLQREIFTPLALGAQLCIAPVDPLQHPEGFAQWVAQEQITIMHWPPVMTRLLAECAQAPSWPLLRTMFFGGDAVRQELIDALRRVAPQATVIGFYGSTEGQRAVGYCSLNPGEQMPRDIMPIGRGAQDVQILIANAGGALAGIGELGEIWVRSPHLAAGYLDDDELSAAKFIINPFTRDPADRIYRTGELGRFLPNGGVEFVARGAHQVSIRGHRVDLAEIESALRQSPKIREAIVVARDDCPGDQRLVAYLVAAFGSKASVRELRSFVRQKLPEYMVPDTFVYLEKLPLTPSGKVDRQTLPNRECDLAESEEVFVAPRNALEETIADIWRKVLGKNQVGIHDNFFALGGHSLRAAQLIARLRLAFQSDIPLRHMFEYPTIAELAAAIGAQKETRADDVNRLLNEIEAMTEEEAQRNLARG